MTNKHLRIIKRLKNTRIFQMSIVFGLVAISIVCFESYSSYKSEVRSLKIRSSNIAHVLEEQMATSFSKIDLVLEDLQGIFEKERTLEGKSKEYNALFLARKKRLPEVLSFKAVNAEGEFIGDDMGVLSTSNLRDREYFQEMKARPTNGLVISRPVVSKTAHVWVLVLARSILSPEGQFRGMVFATIPISHYQQLFSQLNVGNEGSILLYGFNNVLYARKPMNEEYTGKTIILAPAVRKLIDSKENADAFRAVSRVDGIERIYGLRKMRDYPFVVIVGHSVRESLFPWTMRTVFYIVVSVSLFVIFIHFLLNFLQTLEQLEEQRKNAIQSGKLTSLGEMASGIAHEINNPLTIISTIAITMRRPDTGLESDVKHNKSIDRIITTVDRIAKIIRGLRSFSRDSFDDPMVPFSVHKIIENTFELCQEKLKNKKITLKLIPFTDFTINCREVQISQVIMNLLNNSLDALEGMDDKWIKIEVLNFPDRAQIVVSDSGRPIPPEIAEKIMLPFFTTKEVGKGTGLGLSISRGIIEGHGGRFFLDTKASRPTFVIELLKT